jgi:hypothetical protein
MVFVSKIKDVFAISGRGVVIALDRGTWAPDVTIRKNDAIQLRAPDGKTLDTKIVSIEFLRGPGADRSRGILLPEDIGKDQLAAETEIWLISD